MPQAASYESRGVLKIPDAKPAQLGFDAQFFPTYAGSSQTGV